MAVVPVGVVTLAVAGPISADKLAELGIPDARRGVVATEAAKRWELAMPIGNGSTGALVMGHARDETLIISRAGLFLPFTPPMPPIRQGDELGRIRALMAKGGFQEAADFVYDMSLKDGYGGTRWTDPFSPVCSLRIRLVGAADGEASGYLRGLDYTSGVAGVRHEDAGGRHVRRAFVSRADDAVVLEIAGGALVDADFSLEQHDPRSTSEKDVPQPGSISLVESSAQDGWLSYHSRFAKAYPESPKGCEAIALVRAEGGKVESKGGVVSVRGASRVLVVLKAAVIRDYAKRETSAMRESLARMPADFSALLGRHAVLHSAIFRRMRLDLGGASQEEYALPVAELFARSKLGATNPTLLSKQFDACRYLILSSSGGEYPPNLQGVWAGTWYPAWSGDYTHDGNVPVAIIGSAAANMTDTMSGYFKYHESMMEGYRENARRLFNARGIVVPARTGNFGYANHFGPRWCLTFWTAGAAWVAHTYNEYWLHTGDRVFLREKAIPFMKEAALFYEDFLAGTEGADGKYVFSPSYSPENDPVNTKSQAAVNSTMDIAACRELLTNLVAACRAEGLDPEGVARWQAMLAKLPAYRINGDGALAEWAWPSLQDNYAHRHVSHMYELYDGLTENVAGDAKLMEAFKVALRKRTDWRRQIGGGEMAFGQAQMGAVAASLRLPELAYENVEMLANWFWFPENMMTSHNPASIFNTDIAGGIPHLIIRMLVDDQPGWIELLPALPKEWAQGRIEGVSCRGRVELRSLSWSAESVQAVLVSPVAQTVELRVGGRVREKVVLAAGAEKEVRIAR